MTDMLSRPLFVAEVIVDTVQSAGGPAGAGRRLASIGGGRFAGDRLRGDILAGGVDWMTERSDGSLLLDAILMLKTDDDAIIAMTYTGIRRGPDDVMAALARGEAVDPARYYFRTRPVFSTSDPRYDWLNGIVAVGIGERQPSGPVYQIYEIL